MEKQRVKLPSRASVLLPHLQTHGPLARPPVAPVQVMAPPLTVPPLHPHAHLSPTSTPQLVIDHQFNDIFIINLSMVSILCLGLGMHKTLHFYQGGVLAHS